MPIATPVIHLPDRAGPERASGSYSRAAPAPARIRIPGIGVDSSLAQLGLQADGSIEVPSDFNQAGWYTKGPAPGEPGPAVIVGHVDSYTGPAVFARLSALHAGDRVTISRVDGSQVDFAVQRLATFSVDSFPTQDVYGATPEPALRLITCGASFSPTRRRYLGNLVVFASPR
jgi:sortase (surface protein transpeptidase)